MNWKLKALILWCLAVPAFTGFPINYIHGSLLAAVDYGWIIYGAIVYAAIVLLLGKKIYKITIIIALAIAIPLVLLGTVISLVGLFISGWNVDDLMGIIGHYIHLMATMIVVIPMALSMITILPFHRLESHILQSRHGVGMWQKIVLMFLRVFSHIFYFVIPNILEVIREEGVLTGRGLLTPGQINKKPPLLKRLRKITQALVYIGVESICSAIRFIPLWADEISMLPDKQTLNIIKQNNESSED
jgi:hypothetical protein